MNIVLYTNSFLPAIGGRELVVHHLARTLLELGHDVRVLGPAGWWRLRKYKYDYPVYRYPAMRGRLNEPVRLAQLLADTALRGCDVIHAHATYPVGYAAARLKRIRDVPLILTPHGVDIHVIPELGHGLRLNPQLRPKIEYAVRSADAVTAISDSMEASLLAAGAEPAKIHRISNGVDIERFAKPAPMDVHAWLGLAPDTRLLVTVGNYHPRKGHEWLIRTMPMILARAPNARLIIVGKNTGVLKPLIEELGLGAAVLLTGALSGGHGPDRAASRQQEANPDRLAALYANSVAYISAGTAEGAEGLSLAVLEAMAAGLPVVATDISGNRDIVRDGENGYLVAPGDREMLAERITRLIGEDALRGQMGARARESVRQRGWLMIARQYLELYRSVIDRRDRAIRTATRN